jgi:hypothetical protein
LFHCCRSANKTSEKKEISGKGKLQFVGGVCLYVGGLFVWKLKINITTLNG